MIVPFCFCFFGGPESVEFFFFLLLCASVVVGAISDMSIREIAAVFWDMSVCMRACVCACVCVL